MSNHLLLLKIRMAVASATQHRGPDNLEGEEGDLSS